jgi:addiction module HigA family antidote
LTAGALAKAMGLAGRTRIERVARGTQPVTPDTALRLEPVFGASAQYWLNLQAQHDLSLVLIARKTELLAIRPVRAA